MENNIKFDYLWENGPLMAQSEHFKLGTDSVLLGNFANVAGTKKGCDLGCCTGALSLLLLSRNEKLHIDAIEIDCEASDIAKKNMEINGLDGRANIITGDLRDYRKYFKSGAYDIVISNPPYFTVESGDVSDNERKARARGEVSCTIEDIVRASKYLLRWDGKLFLVFRPERMVELLTVMSENAIEPKRIRPVAHKFGAKPSLILVEGRRGGKSGLTLEDTLYIVDKDGNDTAEIKDIYHR